MSNTENEVDTPTDGSEKGLGHDSNPSRTDIVSEGLLDVRSEASAKSEGDLPGGDLSSASGKPSSAKKARKTRKEKNPSKRSSAAVSDTTGLSAFHNGDLNEDSSPDAFSAAQPEFDLAHDADSESSLVGDAGATEASRTVEIGRVDWSEVGQNLDFVSEASDLPELNAFAQAELAGFAQASDEELIDSAKGRYDGADGPAIEIPDELAGLAAADIDDSDPAPTEFVEADQLISIIESLLFSTDKPVSPATIKVIFKGTNVRTKDITRALDHLASEYAASSRGVTLEEINGGYQLRTKVDNSDFLRRLAKVRPFRLSGPALEVMAIVAYKQPVTKHEIDEIRGVESGHLLRALMERGLVNFGGKSDLPGKPMTYGSTRKFLEIFGLRNLKELPTLSEIDELLPQGIGEVEEKESLSELTDRMSNELTSSYSEGEDELEKINSDLQGIDTTSEFFAQEKQRERDKRDREKAQDLRERLMVGEAVEEKDRRWLDRYEAKLQAIETSAQAGNPQTIAASDIEAAPEIGAELSALSEDSDAVNGGTEARSLAADVHHGNADLSDDEMEARADAQYASDEDLEDDGEDLTAVPDWDEESEADRES